jgi:hypothetical protein
VLLLPDVLPYVYNQGRQILIGHPALLEVATNWDENGIDTFRRDVMSNGHLEISPGYGGQVL